MLCFLVRENTSGARDDLQTGWDGRYGSEGPGGQLGRLAWQRRLRRCQFFPHARTNVLSGIKEKYVW